VAISKKVVLGCLTQRLPWRCQRGISLRRRAFRSSSLQAGAFNPPSPRKGAMLVSRYTPAVTHQRVTLWHIPAGQSRVLKRRC
jgi:hypothetical protein